MSVTTSSEPQIIASEIDNEIDDLLIINTSVDGLYTVLDIEHISIKKNQPIRDYVKSKWNHIMVHVSNQTRLLTLNNNTDICNKLLNILNVIDKLRPSLLRVFPGSPASVYDINIIREKVNHTKNFFDTF